MNRCLASPPCNLASMLMRPVLWLSLCLFSAAATAQAPLRVPPIPQTAALGQLVVVASPELLLNGQAARLSPGARIRGQNNLLVTPASLHGQPLAVRYVIDSNGQLRDVWILTEAELQALVPAPTLLPDY